MLIVDMQSPTDNETGRMEASAGGELISFEGDTVQEPYEGMLFESEGAAKAFYDEYARRALQTQKRDRRREGCTAMILVKREKPGQWIVRKFVRDHNHPLVVQLQKSRPTLDLLTLYIHSVKDEKDKKIQELTAELRVKKRLTSAYREQLLMFVKDVENHNEHLSKKVEVVVDNLKDLEAKRQELLQHR
ncbi:hypothetical protein CK203_082491 [Vitis vinifera]|uniref:FAR1 domain-containing protein n=1 Tax=Vitis vinifera TaxID=29760 RepID=A0A438DK11_VITVI|nr:hypothetical protein CK203_082491 [Vitis vinifera]